MYEVGQVVLYGTQGVCEIAEICDKKIGQDKITYYVLQPVHQSGTKCFVPVKNEHLVSRMRQVLNTEQVNQLIENAADMDTIWIADENTRKTTYKEIISGGDREKIIQVLKTLYMHQIKQGEKGKRLHITDDIMFKEAQKLICDEFAYTLNIEPQQVMECLREKSAVI